MFTTELIQDFTSLVTVNVTASQVKEENRYWILKTLIDAAVAGICKADVKAWFTESEGADWPTGQDGLPVGENKARKTRYGAAWNSLCSNGYAKYMIDKEGVPILSTDDEGNNVLCPKSAGGKGAKPELPKHLQPEQEAQEVKAELLDHLKANNARHSQEFLEFRDRVRAKLTAKEFAKIEDEFNLYAKAI